ncbi:NB-ARC domain-containing protein [Variovorax sp. GT1P44]|uniref:NB-ARC domain-containing protein n=1 Tax=Variovorax sp. GT1P44 TaxID=3443742 RepID=UPI003F472479
MRIHSQLFPPRLEASSLDPALQLHGMAGVGKTEVAAAYVNTFALAYPGGVFWLNLAGFHPPSPVDETAAAEAGSRALHALFAHEPSLQRALLHDTDGKPLSAVAARESVSRWLATAPGPYLWIVDNVPPMSPLDGRDRIFQWLRAPTPGGRTIVTTRDSRIAAGFTEECLDVLEEAEALALLARYRAIQESERENALSLVRRVGGHTLALVLLGEHLRQGEGHAAMLQRLLHVGLVERLEVIAELLRPELGERARSVVAAFSLSVSDLLPDAKRLLGLAAMCAPVEPIPDELLRTAFGVQGVAESRPPRCCPAVVGAGD